MFNFKGWNPTKPFDYLDDETKAFIPGIGDAMATDKANAQNASHAQKQMDFQERMSNSSYQRAMDDMKKAGLNPMLAMSQGGASTPSGAAATVQPSTKTKLGEFAMNAATGVSGVSAQQKLADNTVADSIQNRQLSATQSAKNVADAERTRIETIKAKKDVPKAEWMNKKSQEGFKIIDRILENVSSSAKNTRDLFSGKANVKVLGPGPKIPWSKQNSKKDN